MIFLCYEALAGGHLPEAVQEDLEYDEAGNESGSECRFRNIIFELRRTARRKNKKNKKHMVIHYQDRKGCWKVPGPQLYMVLPTAFRVGSSLRKGGPHMTQSAIYPEGYGVKVQKLHQDWKAGYSASLA